MAEDDQFWYHAGITELKKKENSYVVRVPNRVFRDEDILKLGRYVNWHYNKVTGVLIATHDHLEKDDYFFTKKSTKFREGDSEYHLTVPKLFFPDSEGVKTTGVDPEWKDDILLPTEGFLHFVYNREMVEGETKSCYVLTEEQADDWLSDSDEWDGDLDDAPKFFS